MNNYLLSSLPYFYRNNQKIKRIYIILFINKMRQLNHYNKNITRL